MIIDHVDRLDLPDEVHRSHANELRSLSYLAQGLRFLYQQVDGIEDKVKEQLPKDQVLSIYGNAPQLKWAPQGLVACAFHWYAVSASNYVRLVGWLANGQDPQKAKEYVERVIPEVTRWRNKIGGHFARSDPRKEDTPADLAMSVIFPVSFDDDAFYAGSVKLLMSQGGKSSASRTDLRWSVTHTHRYLCQRYWPDALAKE
ncbi:MAG: hypothetical protein Q8R28_14085 [Dehalococcoidia bacterium]|nr:hypothetical protein [Dehalococcoidia bacterium]